MQKWTSSAIFLVVTGILSSALGELLFTLNKTQNVYQAEEHSNITLTWSQLDHNSTHPESFYIDVMSKKPLRVIYSYNSRFHHEPYMDELFRSRLQCDPLLVRNGQFKCLLTNLKINDTGLYKGIFVIHGRYSTRNVELVVKASSPQARENQEPVDRDRIGIYAALGLFFVATGGLGTLLCYFI